MEFKSVCSSCDFILFYSMLFCVFVILCTFLLLTNKLVFFLNITIVTSIDNRFLCVLLPRIVLLLQLVIFDVTPPNFFNISLHSYFFSIPF